MSVFQAPNQAPHYRRHPAGVWGAGTLLVIAAMALASLAGCQSDDPARPDQPQDTILNGTVLLEAQPEFAGGTTNTISWTAEAGTKTIPDGWSFLAQRSTDVTFETEVDESPWVSEDHHTFTELVDGTTNNYRVKARDGEGRESEWSLIESSTQDSQPPVATVMAMIEDQTSLLFNVEIAANEDASGVSQIELWYRKNGGELQLHGLVEPGVLSFQTDVGGPHEFFALATDNAGNTQQQPTEAQATTLVPEPIILVDSTGFEWDVTNAVLKHGIHLNAWEFGLGRFTIRPAIDPPMSSPGDGDYPDPNNLADVVAVNFEGDARAYKIGDLSGREVADDVVNGVPIAATY